MKCRKRLEFILLFVMLLANVTVLAGNSRPPQTRPKLRLEYVVRVDDLASHRLHVQMHVAGHRGGKVLLRGLPIPSENPTPQAVGDIVQHLDVRNSTAQLPAVKREIGADGLPIYAMQSSGSRDLFVDYDLLPNFEDSEQTRQFPIVLPFMTARQAWLLGNCVFLAPVLQVNEKTAIHVKFQLAPGIRLIGTDKDVRIGSLYQLMSMQFGLGEFTQEESSAAGVSFSLLYRDPGDFTATEHKAILRSAARIMSQTVGLFGGAPFSRFSFLVARSKGNSFSGLEGLTSCHLIAASGTDLSRPESAPAKYFYVLMQHELFHSWNPIAFSSTEDPWIKEGITEYYGNVLAARLGFLAVADVDRMFDYYFRQLEDNPLMNRIALTDTRLREAAYTDEQWRTVVYERGQVVALLLDVQIRRNSRGRRSLDSVMRVLFRHFRNRSFGHLDLLNAIRQETGTDAGALFGTYVEGKQAPARDQVKGALSAGEKFGVFASNSD